MPAAFLVECLYQLRAEFNAISPHREKGADGWIGDTAHQKSLSDHNPDVLGRVLAIDIDSTGPWPGGFDHYVQHVVARQKTGADSRLEYVIWNRRIASRNSRWQWQTYTGTTDPHTNHAHFSARHDHTGNTSGNSWALADQQEDDMPTAAEIATAVWAAELGRTNRVSTGVLLQNAAAGTAVVAAIQAGQVDVTELAAALAPAIIAGLPDGTLTQDDVEQAVRDVLRTGVDE